MKTILTLDKANQPYGFPQLDNNGAIPANIVVAGTASYAISSNVSYTSNFSSTASYTLGGATTGSNIFIGNQYIIGSITISGSSSVIGGNRNTLYLKNSNSSGNQSNMIEFGSEGTPAVWSILNDLSADGEGINQLDFYNTALENSPLVLRSDGITQVQQINFGHWNNNSISYGNSGNDVTIHADGNLTLNTSNADILLKAQSGQTIISGSTTINGNQTISGSTTINGNQTIIAPVVLPQLDFNTSNSAGHGLTNYPYAIWAQQGYVFIGERGNSRRISVYDETLTLVYGPHDIHDELDASSGISQIWGDGTDIYISTLGDSISKWNFNIGTETLSLVNENRVYDQSPNITSNMWGYGGYLYTVNSDGANYSLKVYDTSASPFDTTAAIVAEYTDEYYDVSTMVYVVNSDNIFLANINGIRSFQFKDGVLSLNDTNPTSYGSIYGISSDGTYLYMVSGGVDGQHSLLYAFDVNDITIEPKIIDLSSEFGTGYMSKVWCDDSGHIWVSNGENTGPGIYKIIGYTFDGTNFTKVASTDFAPNYPVGMVNTMTNYYVLTSNNIWKFSKTLTPQHYGDGLSVTGSIQLTGSVIVNGADIKPYKVYTALLYQDGTNNPTATVLENTLGFNITWTRTSTGAYQSSTIDPSGIGDCGSNTNKVFLMIGEQSPDAAPYNGFIHMRSYYGCTVFIQTKDDQPDVVVLKDGILWQTPIEIRAYN